MQGSPSSAHSCPSARLGPGLHPAASCPACTGAQTAAVQSSAGTQRLSIGTCRQRPDVQTSSVHEKPSSVQVSPSLTGVSRQPRWSAPGSPGRHVPKTQSPVSQRTSIGRCRHVPAAQESSVQASRSSQSSAVPAQRPATQRSVVVHASPSSHVRPSALAGLEQMPLAGSQVPAS